MNNCRQTNLARKSSKENNLQNFARGHSRRAKKLGNCLSTVPSDNNEIGETPAARKFPAD